MFTGKTIDYCVKDASGRVDTRHTIRVGHFDEKKRL